MGLTFDGLTKVITLTTGTTSLSVRELWSRWTDWFLTSDNSKYLPAFSQVGGDDIDPATGTTIPIYAFLMNGWKLKPQESNHTLTINDGILLVDGGGDPFNNTSGAYTVRINYQQPVQAITVSTGGGTSATPAEIWSYSERTITSASSILSEKIDGEYTLEQVLQIMVAALAGKLSGGGTNTLTFRDLSDTLDRIRVSVNNLAERTEVIIDV